MSIPDSILRRLAHLTFRQAHRVFARPFRDAELCQDAMVFAPHPDDEALGCGGTVALKRGRGATINIVFMTDGSRSHEGLIAAEDLGRERQREAMAAAASLGIDTQQVTWLGFPDGGLAKHHAPAMVQVADLIGQKRPAQVFVPYSEHEHPDHVETRLVVYEALAQARVPALVCEYPIWYMNQWPFVRNQRPDPKALLLAGPGAVLGPGLLAPFNVRVDLATVEDRKRRALAEHKSQMVRRNGDPRWHTLADTANGDFLENFFATEIFRCVSCP
jgi:LmbE family N-acetylglucosaminyl deacetylase